MNDPDDGESGLVAHSLAALQRKVPRRPLGRGELPSPPARGPHRSPRSRGPHPLPIFLATITAACAGDQARLARVLEGLRRYQAAAPALPRPARPEVARMGSVTLRDHGGSGPVVVLVPSLINSPDVLDLAPGNSLAAALAGAGLHVLSVDWGDTEAHGLDAAVSERLVPLVASLDTPVALAGYCLGGTLAVAAAALLGSRVRRVALLATPWHFGGYDEGARAGLAAWWAGAEPLAETLGSVPIDLLQPAFWALDAEGVAAKYAALGSADAATFDSFVRLEDWANGGAPLSIAATRDLAGRLFAADASGAGDWTIAGQRIDAGALTIPILDVIAGRDRIVPPASALSTRDVGTPLRLDAGHVGMVVGRRAPEMLWAPLADWLQP